MKPSQILGKTGYIKPYIHMAIFILIFTQSSKSGMLVWNYKQPILTNTTFEVWHSTTLTNFNTNWFGHKVIDFSEIKSNIPVLLQTNICNWSLFATTSKTNFPFKSTNKFEFFKVRAISNGIPSDWSN